VTAAPLQRGWGWFGLRRSGTGRGAVLTALAAAALAVVLSGCAPLSAVLDSERALQDAGYQSVGVSFHFATAGEVLDASVRVSAPATISAVQNVASIVWQHFHERFDFLDVTVHGTTAVLGGGAAATLRMTYSFAELTSDFGARNPSWNKTTIGSGLRRGAIEAGLAVVAVAAVIVGIVVLNRRRRPAMPVGAGHAGGPGQAAASWPPGGYAGGAPAPGGHAGGGHAGGGPPPAGYPMWPPPPYPPRPPRSAPPEAPSDQQDR
jgi:hypothetical protein